MNSTPTRKIYVAVNERGNRIGESHHKAVLTDHEIDLMLDLRDQGFSIRWLAEKFEMSRSGCWQICAGKFRLQRPSGWRQVFDKEVDE